MVGRAVGVGLAVLLCGLDLDLAHAHTEALLEQDFERPLYAHEPTCGAFVDPRPLQQLYAPSAGSFLQQGRVQTLLPQSPRYADASATAGRAVIGLVADGTAKFALTGDGEFLDYMNIAFDVSAINVEGCEGPFNLGTPRIRVSVFDTPGGVFQFGGGTLMDSTIVEGSESAQPWSFTWRRVVASLQSGDPTDGQITIVFEALGGGYVAIDNILIVGDHAPGDPGGITPQPVADAGADAGARDASVDGEDLVDAACGLDAPLAEDASAPVDVAPQAYGGDARSLDAESIDVAPAAAGGGGCSCSWGGGAPSGTGPAVLLLMMAMTRLAGRRRAHDAPRGHARSASNVSRR